MIYRHFLYNIIYIRDTDKYIHKFIGMCEMLLIKSINTFESKPISLLIDSTTTLPCLYPMLYTIGGLRFKSESTQQSYLQGIKQWYEFWQEKYQESFCKYFYVHKSNPKLITQAIESFILYLESSNSSDIKLIRLGNNQLINYSTLASRLRAVLGYLDYLLDNFSQEYGKPLNSEITRYKSIIAQKNKMVANLSATHNKNHKAKTNFKSLTEEMRSALYTLIKPMAKKPLFRNKETQLRNFLMVHLLVNYGLRRSELLLLTLNSIKTDKKTNNTFLLIDDTQDKTDSRKIKPHMKNQQSKRIILLEKRDVDFIKMYIENIRSNESKSNMLFLSLQPPYSPISKSGFKKILMSINNEMQKQFPQFFDRNYVDSIDKVSAHILRHTWAYLMLKHSYESYSKNHNNEQSLNLAIENLRKMAGWSLNSSMPYLYANRFISENANKLNIQ